MNILFVCSQNRLRSPTAEAVFSEYEGLACLSAGTAADSETPLSADLIEWAQIIFAMENHHRNKILKRYGKPLGKKRLIVLQILDDYDYMNPELITLLKTKVSRYLRQ